MSPHIHPGSVDDLTQLYRETVLRHAHHPVGFGKSIRETHRNEQFNPLCGDHIVLKLQVEADQVLDAAFEGEACAICKASASLLCEQAPGLLIRQLTEKRQWLESALEGSQGQSEHPELQPLLGVRDYPSRIRCALLPWEALEAAL